MAPHPALLLALDLGDRLADALDAGDPDRIAAAAAEREAAVAVLRPLPPADALPESVGLRLKAQDARLRSLVDRQRELAGADLAGAVRAAHAHSRYRPPAPPARLDTAPR